MKRAKFPLLLAALAMAIVIQPAIAQSGSGQDPASPPATTQTSPSSTTPTMSDSTESETFTGKVAKLGGKYVLKDDTTRTAYTLDDQDRAKQFDGKMVKVTGRLDASSNIIRVATIEPGS